VAVWNKPGVVPVVAGFAAMEKPPSCEKAVFPVLPNALLVPVPGAAKGLLVVVAGAVVPKGATVF
jgi:hypothetical protein